MTRSTANPLIDSLERIRLTTRVSQQEWLDILGIHWDDYLSVKSGNGEIEDKTLEALANRFHFSTEALVENTVDYRALAIAFEPASLAIPERYINASHGRRRASINSVDFLEQLGGWRLRLDVLDRFEFPESELQDPFAPISVRFMSDLCGYLNRRQYKNSALFAMGVHTYMATRKTIVGKIFSDMRSVRELYEHFFSDCMRLFESNCRYQLTAISESRGVLEVISDPDVAEQLGVRHIGNRHLCAFKAGMISCIPMYIGRPMASVKETECVHRGDEVCRFEFSFSDVEAS